MGFLADIAPVINAAVTQCLGDPVTYIDGGGAETTCNMIIDSAAEALIRRASLSEMPGVVMLL